MTNMNISELVDVEYDSVKIATSYWLVELGELDGTFSRSEQAFRPLLLSTCVFPACVRRSRAPVRWASTAAVRTS